MAPCISTSGLRRLGLRVREPLVETRADLLRRELRPLPVVAGDDDPGSRYPGHPGETDQLPAQLARQLHGGPPRWTAASVWTTRWSSRAPGTCGCSAAAPGPTRRSG